VGSMFYLTLASIIALQKSSGLTAKTLRREGTRKS
jgi:hypothetical protein